MPELPEVQTIVNELNRCVSGHKIESVQINRESIIKNDCREFEKLVANRKISSVVRKGKYLLFKLDSSFVMIVHLRMTGKFIVRSKPIPDLVFNRALFYLDQDLVLIYNDVRCFGTIEVTDTIGSNAGLNRLGWDPWDDQLTSTALGKKLISRSTSIKSLLLDQRLIAGLGNIYASEILFDAAINPFARGDRLNKQQLERLIRSTRFILTEAIKHNGTSISDFRRVDDKPGSFQDFLKVYGKQDQPCYSCSTPIVKVKQNQRSTYLCPHCQS
jgi:formamidopyrimidine-DNA glycosylase